MEKYEISEITTFGWNETDDMVFLSCPKCGGCSCLIGDVDKYTQNYDFPAHKDVPITRIEIYARGDCGHHWIYTMLSNPNGLTLWFANVRDDEPLDYETYIKSDEWQEKSSKAKKKAGWRCQLCNKEGSSKSLHAHHRTYERLGNEWLDDITVLCAECHAKFHDK